VETVIKRKILTDWDNNPQSKPLDLETWDFPHKFQNSTCKEVKRGKGGKNGKVISLSDIERVKRRKTLYLIEFYWFVFDMLIIITEAVSSYKYKIWSII